MRPVIAARVEVQDGVVIAAEKLGDGGKRHIGEGPLWVGSHRRFAGNVRQPFSAALVGAQIARSPAEADVFKMIEQSFCRFTGRAARATDRVSDPRDPSDI